MKERITFLYEAEGQFNPEQITVNNDSISVRSLHGPREDRTTFSFNELPQELWQVLKRCHELHIRWASDHVYDALPPFTSRVSPGLHVFYSPISQELPSSLLCPLLRKMFDDGLECELPETSFIPPPVLAVRSSSTPSLQFHQLLPSLSELVTFIQQKLCPAYGDRNTDAYANCQSHASSLLSVDSLDIDYQSSTHSFSVAAYWSKPSQKGGWSETIHKLKKSTDRVEIGILAMEDPREPHELSMGGFLAVVGEDTKLSPTLFSYPSRHHPLPLSSKYTITFPKPTGLHPTLHLSLPRSSLTSLPERLPPSVECSLYTYLTLPSPLFADKYQLSTKDPLFLHSHNLLSLHAIAGETDLEAPDWLTKRWGSSVLLELATPKGNDKANTNDKDTWQISIPLHLRYLPTSPGGYRNISMPWPVVFWACANEGMKMGRNPFDRVRLGWDDLFAPNTLYYHFHPDPSAQGSGAGGGAGSMVEKITVPVLKIRGAWDVWGIEIGTMVVVFLGFLWVVGKLRAVAWGRGRERGLRGGREKRE
ncbi:hypothetical protein ACO22_05695 [Paracoccidioides brasiliensis]|uniref:Protein PBN1 n=1 Tax=Paracoccidioides brasiliensis TaxID=121759 RepID=A0A1D2J9W4_PARBR|nr:hypothetical protein ACO22_05695 [Paracoccidioides brasiliensis]